MFVVRDATGRIALGPAPAEAAGAFAGCTASARLDFSALHESGTYTIAAGTAPPVRVRIAPDVYRGTADSLLAYMRQQRSLFNPLFRDSVHHRTDALLVDHPEAGTFLPVAGGWADAADYLQYVTTSAHATFVLLAAYRDHPSAFTDAFDARGLPGGNGISDVLDEARWGLEWLVRMHPREDLILNQIADDRDHMNADLPTTDASAVTEPPVATTPTTEAPVATTVAPTTTTAPAPTTTTVAPWPVIDTGDVWYQLAQCESGGNWAHQGTYHGGLQFHPSTWVAYGGQEFASYAYQASAQQQITVGKRIVASQGGTFKAWPGCRRKLGLP
jgi:hypothetical protein